MPTALAYFFRSYQVAPDLLSTFSGTSSFTAESIMEGTSSSKVAISSSGASKTSSSWICKSIRARKPRSFKAFSIRIMAILMMSAADP